MVTCLEPTRSASEVALAAQGDHAYTLLPHRRNFHTVVAYRIVPAATKSAYDDSIVLAEESRSRPFSYGKDHTLQRSIRQLHPSPYRSRQRSCDSRGYLRRAERRHTFRTKAAPETPSQYINSKEPARELSYEVYTWQKDSS